MKSMIFTFVFFAFVLVALTQLPQLQGMPWESKLSHIATTTMQYMREVLEPIEDFFYYYFY